MWEENEESKEKRSLMRGRGFSYSRLPPLAAFRFRNQSRRHPQKQKKASFFAAIGPLGGFNN
jgi:hypothetical protein